MDATLLHWLQTSDSAFPVGAFAHSMGLEGWITEGLVRDEQGLVDFLNDIHVPLLTRIDLPILRLSAAAAAVPDWPELARLDALAWAGRGSREAREASANIGTQRLRLLHDLTPSPLLAETLANLRATTLRGMLPVVSGIEATACAIPVRSAQLAYSYQSIAAIFSASMKLMRIGQRAVQRILRTHALLIPEWVDASDLTPRNVIGGFFPSLDVCEARHETTWTRIFIS